MSEQATDLNKDGQTTAEEAQAWTLLKKTRAQTKMAWVSLAAMIAFTAVLFTPFVTDERITLLSNVSDLFYIANASVVGAYMGFTAWMSKR